MYKYLFLSSVLALSACGGSAPFGGSDGTDVGTDTPAGSSTDDNERYFGDDDDMNNLVYDSDADELIINNLPFDGVDGRYVNTGMTILADFDIYASQSAGEEGHAQYYAVYAQSANGHVGAAGTTHYTGFGHGGAVISRTSSDVTLPVARGELLYTGSYAGIRVPADDGTASGIRFSDGDVELYVDLLDFDVTGAVHGGISNRQEYTEAGALIGTLDGISLNETVAITDDGLITGTTSVYGGADPSVYQTGTYNAIFAGENGEQILGTLVMTGDIDPDDSDAGTVQETGVFILTD
jgi:hypothetical protein